MVEGRTQVLSFELDVLLLRGGRVDSQRAVWDRFMDVVNE